MFAIQNLDKLRTVEGFPINVDYQTYRIGAPTDGPFAGKVFIDGVESDLAIKKLPRFSGAYLPRIKDEDTPEERFEILGPEHMVVTRAGDVILAGGNIVIKRGGVIYLGGKQGIQVAANNAMYFYNVDKSTQVAPVLKPRYTAMQEKQMATLAGAAAVGLLWALTTVLRL